MQYCNIKQMQKKCKSDHYKLKLHDIIDQNILF